MKLCGIYAIINVVNGCVYIGQSVNIYGRWKTHKSELNNNKHRNKYLQRAWNKYGCHAFLFAIVLACNKTDLNSYEMKIISKLKSVGRKIYNLTDGGTSVRKRTKEENNKESLSRIGTLNPMFGKHHSKSTKEKRNAPEIKSCVLCRTRFAFSFPQRSRATIGCKFP